MSKRALSAVRLLLLATLSLGGCADILGFPDDTPPDAGVPGTCVPGSTRACYSGPPETEDAGGCRGGLQVCNQESTGFGPCLGEVAPAEGGSVCACAPGTSIACYEGLPGTQGVGPCAGGTRSCKADGTGYGPCEGQVLPAVEQCSIKPADSVNQVDESCDGITACEGSYRWAHLYGDGAEQLSTSIAVDGAGNVFVTGHIQGTVDFGGGPLGPADTNSTGKDNDVFLLKLDAQGRHLWSKRFGDAGNQLVRAVAVDAQGNVFITGDFDGSINFGGAAGALPSAAVRDLFVAGFDPQGNPLWSKSFSSAGDDFGFAIAVGKDNHVVVTGALAGDISFGGDVIKGKGNYDVFVAKLEGTQGGHLWSHGFGDAFRQVGSGIAVDPESGDVVVTGEYQGIFDFGGPLLTTVPNDQAQIFVAKLQGDSGAHVWSRGSTLGDIAGQFGQDVAIAKSGDIFIAGVFTGKLDFGDGMPKPEYGLLDVYLAKLDRDGNHLWSKSLGDSKDQSHTGVAVDGAGNVVLLVGEVIEPLSFSTPAQTLPPLGLVDLALAKFDPAGSLLWSRRFAGGGDDLGAGIAVSPRGDVLLTGTNLGSGVNANFGGGPLPNKGLHDLVVASLAP